MELEFFKMRALYLMLYMPFPVIVEASPFFVRKYFSGDINKDGFNDIITSETIYDGYEKKDIGTRLQKKLNQ